MPTRATALAALLAAACMPDTACALSLHRLKLFSKSPEEEMEAGGAEAELCAALAQAMQKEISASGDRQKAWDDNFQDVYKLADMTMGRIKTEWK